MEILLINPVIRSWERPSIFPLGLGYIARALREAGHSVQVLDINAHRWNFDEVERRIRGCAFDVVGITGLLTEYGQFKRLSPLLKRERPGCTIVLGGGLPSVVPELVLQETDADIAVVGEGEATVVDVVDALAESRDLSTVKGIRYKRSGAVLSTPPREAIPSVDGILFPAWDLFPMETYVTGSALGFDPPIRSMNMITSRGCPYSCTYCDHSIFGSQFRVRSVDNILQEMKLLRDRYKVKAIAFVDDLFLLDRKRVYAFCDRLLSERVNMCGPAMAA